MDATTYENLAVEMDKILSDTWELRRELCEIRNLGSYLDSKILFEEFMPEIEAAQTTREEQALAKYGWTWSEFQAECTRIMLARYA